MLISASIECWTNVRFLLRAFSLVLGKEKKYYGIVPVHRINASGIESNMKSTPLQEGTSDMTNAGTNAPLPHFGRACLRTWHHA